MKTQNIIHLAIVILLVISSSVYSQYNSNPIYFTNDISIIYYEGSGLQIWNAKTGEKTFVSHSIKEYSVGHISKIRFLSDSLISVSNYENSDLIMKISGIKEIRINNGSYLLTGIGLGALAGLVAGAALGSIIGSESESESTNGFHFNGLSTDIGLGIGAAAGLLIGGITGGIIGGNNQTYETIDINGNISELKKILYNNRK